MLNDIVKKLFIIILGIFVLGGKANAGSDKVVFQIPVQIDYAENISPYISCKIYSSTDVKGWGALGGLPHQKFQKLVNVTVRAFAGQRLSKGMKYECNLYPDYVPIRGQGLNGVARRAQELEQIASEIKSKAKKTIFKVSGVL